MSRVSRFRAPNGDRRADIVTAPARARVARRVLDALEGQPSECEACGGAELRWNREARVLAECLDCRGSGHNLRGVLPAVKLDEWDKARTMATLADGARLARERPWPRWAEHLGITREQVEAWVAERADPDEPDRTRAESGVTRVVPRGEHRVDPDLQPPTAGYTDEAERDLALMPRWRRGELRHAELRRSKPSRLRGRHGYAIVDEAVTPEVLREALVAIYTQERALPSSSLDIIAAHYNLRRHDGEDDEALGARVDEMLVRSMIAQGPPEPE